MAHLFDNGGEDNSVFSDINVTPLVDVMLVLLIIFMVTAPFMTNTLGVDMPKGQGEATTGSAELFTISINKNFEIFIGEDKFSPDGLAEFLKNSPRIKDGEEVFIEADKDVRHGQLVSVMSVAQKAGVQKIKFLIEKE